MDFNQMGKLMALAGKLDIDKIAKLIPFELGITLKDALSKEEELRRRRAHYEALRDHLAFYPGRVDAAWMDDERVHAQEGDFYGGWITADLVGPFKGGPGTAGW